MCDYSLHKVQYRMAVEGEPLELCRVPSGAMEFTSPKYLQPALTRPSPKVSWWQIISNSLMAGRFSSVPVVYVPPGVQLVLRDVPFAIQQILAVSEEEEVTLIQSGLRSNGKAGNGGDAIQFRNGHEVLLEHLPVGQRFDVLSITSGTEELAIWLAVERLAQAS